MYANVYQNVIIISKYLLVRIFNGAGTFYPPDVLSHVSAVTTRGSIEMSREDPTRLLL